MLGHTPLMKKLAKVHYEVSNMFIYTCDQDKYDKAEYWPDPLDLNVPEDMRFYEDCDGFALMCRKKLDEIGIDNHLIFCKVPDSILSKGGYHLVCEVNGWILGNGLSGISRRDDLNWEWISRSGTKFGDPWHKII